LFFLVLKDYECGLEVVGKVFFFIFLKSRIMKGFKERGSKLDYVYGKLCDTFTTNIFEHFSSFYVSLRID
jgi:hypothetical protein